MRLLFLKKLENNPHLKVESLRKSKKDRNIDLLKLGRLDGKVVQRIVLT